MGGMRQRIVVAGGSLAGHSAVTELVGLVPEAEIVWVTGEQHRTYSKPALSKEFMQARNELSELMLPDIGGDLSNLRIVRRSCASLDTANRTVTLDDGEKIAFDQLLIATGAQARMPGMLRGVGGVFPLRTLDDAVAIRESLAGRPKVLVVGGGLIGCELAASMRTLGLEVTLVERLDTLLDRPFGGAFGSYFLDLHRANGVDLVMDAMVERVSLNDGRVAAVELADGAKIETQLVVVGAGSEPCTQWLEGSGLIVADGVVCDSYLATSMPGIFAAGDVARWTNPIYDLQMRVEHWTNASAQGRAAARNLAASATGRQELRKPFADVPYFWSDQYGQKIQMVGWHQGHDRVELDRSADAPGPLARFYRDGRMIAAAGVNVPRIVMRLRRQIEEEARAQEAA
ncbi:FAD/NAD(P)-binding oxidoreductase [Mesorhizobium sp. YM1C-6-2]|uniref:NAD(P)/FAD-dependent oxidoreductase n=1 Tax=Mesorhizobium sp. YM1C-6-2 TaxID=1827501 RepID=UPI000EF1B6C0|nr:FAD/NAD(P)-binding oxidoreductase [Mesorhizobium sp. YM1C-6-2]RLP28284.1 NAD(P)/FAD-dependent oxidoreductase [Mesorhizobium sp. YM1C-6-2]